MISELLYGLKPPKYLRYLFFVAYNWYRRYVTHRSGAYRIATMFLGMMHMLAYQGIYFLIFPFKGKLGVYIPIFIVIVQFYVWFVYKEKWKLFIEEFKYVGRKQ